jgi:hypothetical protein
MAIILFFDSFLIVFTVQKSLNVYKRNNIKKKKKKKTDRTMKK